MQNNDFSCESTQSGIPDEIWAMLPEVDREPFLIMKNSFSNKSSSQPFKSNFTLTPPSPVLVGTSISMAPSSSSTSLIVYKDKNVPSFLNELRTIKAFIDSRLDNVEERSIISGVSFRGPYISVNIQRIKTLLGRCKSSINKGFQQLKYVSAKSKVKKCVLSSMPMLQHYPQELRQWTLRIAEGSLQLFANTLAPEIRPLITIKNNQLSSTSLQQQIYQQQLTPLLLPTPILNKKSGKSLLPTPIINKPPIFNMNHNFCARDNNSNNDDTKIGICNNINNNNNDNNCISVDLNVNINNDHNNSNNNISNITLDVNNNSDCISSQSSNSFLGMKNTNQPQPNLSIGYSDPNIFLSTYDLKYQFGDNLQLDDTFDKMYNDNFGESSSSDAWDKLDLMYEKERSDEPLEDEFPSFETSKVEGSSLEISKW